MKKYLSLVLIVTILLSSILTVDTASASGNAQPAVRQGANLLLHVGSPIALSDGKILPLDSQNPDLASFIHKERILVPVRMIAEHFGAAVSYDGNTRTAMLTIGEKSAAFPIGKNYITLDGKRIDLDTETLSVSGRIFVPMRVICEQILGLRIDYNESVIYIAETAKLTADMVRETKAKIGMFVKVNSLDELKATYTNRIYIDYMAEMPISSPDLNATEKAEAVPGIVVSGAATDAEASLQMEAPSRTPNLAPAPVPTPVTPSTPIPDAPSALPSTPTVAPGSSTGSDPGGGSGGNPGGSSGGSSGGSFGGNDAGDVPDADYGVDQGVAPDPAPDSSVSEPTENTAGGEVASDDGSTDHSSTNVQVEGIDEGDIVKTDGTYIYVVAGNQLKIVKTSSGGGLTLVSKISLEDDIYASELYIDKDRVIIVGSRYEYSHMQPMIDVTLGNLVSVQVYDVSVKDDPELLRSFDIQGNLTATRKKGDYIYLVTNYGSWGWGIDPRPVMIEDSDACYLPLDDIMVARETPSEAILTVNAINFRDDDEPVTRESITGSGYSTYMSHNALYIAMPDYQNYSSEILKIARFSIDGSKIGYSGSASVQGSINDQFSMDEYDGYFRLATSDRRNAKNNLYVLDVNMDVCGSVLGYAPGERIYSARFMGKRGYVVTFRETDPLFVFDLSNPNSPKITGELKVPGFSSYLHPVSDTVLLGFGRDMVDIIRRDASGKEIVSGQDTGGLKLSLFDVSNAGLPKEIDTLVLGNYGYAEFLNTHKAAMFKSDDNLLAFTAELMEGDKWSADFVGALLISYENNKLSEYGRIPSADGDYSSYGNRLVYIGNTLYFVQSGWLRSFDLTTLEPLQSLSLQIG